MAEKPSRRPSQAPPEEVDTTAQLWDRIADDLIHGSQPCLETVEKLVDEACRRPAAGPGANGGD